MTDTLFKGGNAVSAGDMKTHNMKRSILAIFIVIAVAISQTAAFAADGPRKRSDIEEKYKWKLEDIYQSAGAWSADFEKVQKEYIPAMEELKGKLSDEYVLLKCLRLRDELFRTVEKLYIYARLNSDINQADSMSTEKLSKIDMLAAQAGQAVAFIQPELLEKPEAYIKYYAGRAILIDYKFYLDNLIKSKAHMLSKGEEELLASVSNLSGAPGEIYDKLRLADMKFPSIADAEGKEIQLSPGIFSRALESQDREYRKRAFDGMYGTYDKFKNTFAATLSAEVKKNIFYAKARKYDSAIQASLAGEGIPSEVYDNLVKAVNNNLGYLNKYVELRKKVLQLDKVHLYDMYVKLVDTYEMKIPYEDAKKMVLEGLKPLGKEYVQNLEKAMESRWIDVYETENKETGGYNFCVYDTHPYILMNYNDSVDSMLTLAHELGHAMNSHYTNAAQKYIDSGIPIFTAEVASTANEILMLRYLIDRAENDEEKLYLLNTLVENIRGTVYTQVMYSEFEKLIHERVEKGEALSADTLNGIWKELMVRYYGSSFEADELAPLWWSRIPHFYMNFYVYKYATSMAASNELVKNMTSGSNSEAAVNKYIHFLKAGGSDYPIEVLNKAGADMTSTAPVDNLLAEFGKLVDQMEEILKKQGKIE